MVCEFDFSGISLWVKAIVLKLVPQWIDQYICVAPCWVDSIPKRASLCSGLRYPKNPSEKGLFFGNGYGSRFFSYLVGGLEHLDYFSIYRECHHPNWPTHIFQRVGSTTSTTSTTNQLSWKLHFGHHFQQRPRRDVTKWRCSQPSVARAVPILWRILGPTPIAGWFTGDDFKKWMV